MKSDIAYFEEGSLERATLADSIRRKLADEIMSGALGLDQRLEEAELAERFKVSRTPIREALCQLAATGLIKLRPRRSAVVAPVNIDAVGQGYESAAELEGVAASWAASRSTLMERKELFDLNVVCRKLIFEGDHESFAAANLEFHNKIAVMSRNKSLASATMLVRVQIAPYQRVQFHSEDERHLSTQDHERIVEAVVRADAEAARQEMRKHILRAGINAVAEFNKSRGATSSDDSVSR
ncbi:MAG: GntR family transcriptional regulator [Albidovulum sp.]|nr:GntR family transcriptional regulator [Albidovulum sp.]